jgi:tetratricopeptide (TPR) repeat protein
MPTVKVVANPSKGDGMPESVQETVRTHLDHGGACLDKGKHDEAIADYDKAIALDPSFALAYSNRGLAYAKKGDVDRAIADYDKAIADFRKALEIDPSDHLTKNNLKALGVTP